MMKIVLLNTSEKIGGAAIACNRLMQTLNKNGVEAKMLVRDKITDDTNIVSVNNSYLVCQLNYVRFVWERFCIFIKNSFSKANIFQVSIANTGINICKHPLVKEADIIHIHWINQGFLSLKNIEQLIKLGKPIIWTMHDMWALTGICHHARECSNYQKQCGNCFFINDGKKAKDISYRIFRKKIKLLADKDIKFVCCSYWLNKLVSNSAILKSKSVKTIHNSINIERFCQKDKIVSRQLLGINSKLSDKLIFFASLNVRDTRKGIDYLIDACKIIAANNPDLTNDIKVVVMGQNADILNDLIPFDVISLGYIGSEDDLCAAYNAVDLFVTPSLEENLPNTIMEALSCATPCVGFNIGGIPEMIEHQKNGYIAEYKNSEDLAKGINWVLNEANYNELCINARQKVLDSYSEEIIAKQYIDLYKQCLKDNIAKN